MKFQERLTFANVVSVLALILALAGTGGAAYAAGKIGSAQIKNDAVKTWHIDNGHVRTPDLQKDAVRGHKVRNGSLTGADLRNGSVGPADLNAKARAGLAEAGANVAAGGAVNSWFNLYGGAPTVSNTSAGNYTVSIPGASPTNTSVIAIVNSGFSGAHCEAYHVSAGDIWVRCRDASGTAMNTDFQMILFKS